MLIHTTTLAVTRQASAKASSCDKTQMLLTDLRYATPSPAVCPACALNSPFFLRTNEDPMRTPDPMARAMPTARYCVGWLEEDMEEAMGSGEIAWVERAALGARHSVCDIQPYIEIQVEL